MADDKDNDATEEIKEQLENSGAIGSGVDKSDEDGEIVATLDEESEEGDDNE